MFRRPFALLAAATTVAACATGSSSIPSPESTSTTQAIPEPPAAQWPVRTREHVDLWLHGLAVLMDDTARVPLFRPGYRESVRAAHVRANVTSRLDAERERLRARFATNPQLPLAAQFLPFAFDSWDAMKRAATAFQQTNGDPQRAGDEATARAIAALAGVFPTAADREWLRVFVAALDDESTRYYHGAWVAAQRDRNATLAAVEREWNALRPRLRRFLDNSNQRGGEIELSLPLGGEGRTSGGGSLSNVVAVNFPDAPNAAREALYTFVHEIVGATANAIVDDNVSPADKRSGLADRYVSAAQVRGGLMLLQKAAPDLAAGYARYYLSLTRVNAGADPAASLATAFPLPQGIADGLSKQLDVILGGI